MVDFDAIRAEFLRPYYGWHIDDDCGNHFGSCGHKRAHKRFSQIWVDHGGHLAAQRIFACVRLCSDERLHHMLERLEYHSHIDDPVLYYSVTYGLDEYPGGLRQRIAHLERPELLKALDRSIAASQKVELLQNALTARGVTRKVKIDLDGNFKRTSYEYDQLYAHELRRVVIPIIDEALRLDERGLTEMIAAYLE